MSQVNNFQMLMNFINILLVFNPIRPYLIVFNGLGQYDVSFFVFHFIYFLYIDALAAHFISLVNGIVKHEINYQNNLLNWVNSSLTF